ncbi:hypothetical protein M407DRAFT_27194 [Tulasnella calospora MUT 4182]|uniref:Uncharacterized protein n=1 Tax=Tulasnella calospora MUT 4182 TaxID=1051891 RepID=A0A0C3LPP4_9AGAM|nr:hypothetical protein M407DRAFT_27194 [Tulasnella calospora MUT 4182]
MRLWRNQSTGSNNSENEQTADSNPLSRQRHVVRLVVGRISQATGRVLHQLGRLPRVGFLSILRQDGAAATETSSEQILAVQAARWLLETTSNRGDQISTAKFICSLDSATCADGFVDPDSWKCLLNLTLDAFDLWDSQLNKQNQEVAELFGLAVCRVLLHCPKEGDRWKDIALESSRGSGRFGKALWEALVLACTQYSCHTPDDDQRILHMAVITAASKTDIDFKEYQWVKLSRFLKGDSPVSTAFLSVWARLAYLMSLLSTQETIFIGLGQTIDLSNDQRKLARSLRDALRLSSPGFKSVQGDLGSELDAAQAYTVCLQRARELCQKDNMGAGIRYGLGALIWSYIDPLTTSGSTEIRLLRCSSDIKRQTNFVSIAD